MKIVELCAIDQTMHVFLKGLNKELINEDFDLLCVCSEGPYSKTLKEEGFNIINIPIDREIKPLSNIKSVYRLYKLFRKEKPDIVHVHTPIASVLGRIAAKFAKVPIIIYTAHGFYFHENMSYFKYINYFLIEKYISKFFTDYIFTQSNEDRITAITNNFINEKNIFCIGNGVDLSERFNPNNINNKEIEKLYEQLELSKNDFIVTFIGRLVEEKGIFDLLEGFIKINNPNLKLLIVGDVDQGSRDIITKKIALERYSDNPNIKFLGFRNDIRNILFITDIFCLPSYREGMPRSIIEAMAMECVVVATNIRGCREEVVEEETGFLVKINTPKEITNKINLLINNPISQRNMKKAARIRAELNFDEKEVIKKQINIFKLKG